MKYSPIRSSDGSPLPIAPRDLLWGLLALALLLFVGGCNEWVSAYESTLAGRRSVFYSFATEILGARGPAMILWAMSGAVTLLAVVSWLRRPAVHRESDANDI